MNTTAATRRLPVASVLAFAVGIAIATSPSARAETQGESYEVTGALAAVPGWTEPGAKSAAILAGRALLAHLQDARGALKEGCTLQARNALAASEGLAKAIEGMTVRVAVIDELQDPQDRVTVEDIHVSHDDLLPVYENVDELQVYVPEAARQAQPQPARQGSSPGAGGALREVRDVVATGTVYLPVGEVDHQIQAAQKALDSTPPDVTVAEQALEQAVGSLPTMLRGEFVQPLMTHG